MNERLHRCRKTAFSSGPAPWPSAAGGLPLVMDQHQTALLLKVSLRTLQRQRRHGISAPYRKLGRRIYYTRAAILRHLGVDDGAPSTQTEPKQ